MWSQLSSKGIPHWLVAGVKVKEFSFENFITAWVVFKNREPFLVHFWRLALSLAVLVTASKQYQ